MSLLGPLNNVNFDAHSFKRNINITYRDMPTHEVVTENGNIGFGMASVATEHEISSITNHPASQFLGHWYDFLTDKFRPNSGFHADPIDDSLASTDESLGAACNGNNECCSAANPCKEGGGDCDVDDDCTGELLCGFNNCNPGFDSTDDCCYWPGNVLK